jgi:hypothetical protein
VAKGAAHCSVSHMALGPHTISAVYLGDTNFSGSSTQIHTVAVVVPKPTGYVSSLMTWTFQFTPHYSRVSALTVTGVHAGLTISVGCSGAGCPKHRYVDTVTRAPAASTTRARTSTSPSASLTGNSGSVPP